MLIVSSRSETKSCLLAVGGNERILKTYKYLNQFCSFYVPVRQILGGLPERESVSVCDPRTQNDALNALYPLPSADFCTASN